MNRSTTLSPAQRLAVAAHLQSFTGTHPWTPDVAARSAGWHSERRQPVTRVHPTLVVEIDADTSTANGRFRHLTRLIRIRPDLHPNDLACRASNRLVTCSGMTGFAITEEAGGIRQSMNT
jgi:ATP-dependent DNA ligase